MESLESKLIRLSPEQQREVEDFIDFLLHRNDDKSLPPVSSVSYVPAHGAGAPPPMTLPEPVPYLRAQPVSEPTRRQDTDGLQPDAGVPPGPLHEIVSQHEDSLTADYMDYGKYEPAQAPPPSPATEAVQRVKIRLSAKKAGEPVKDLLEWID